MVVVVVKRGGKKGRLYQFVSSIYFEFSFFSCVLCNGRGPALAPSKLVRRHAIGPIQTPRLRPTHATSSCLPPMHPTPTAVLCYCAPNFKSSSSIEKKRNKTRTIQLESWSSDVSASLCYQVPSFDARPHTMCALLLYVFFIVWYVKTGFCNANRANKKKIIIYSLLHNIKISI